MTKITQRPPFAYCIALVNLENEVIGWWDSGFNCFSSYNSAELAAYTFNENHNSKSATWQVISYGFPAVKLAERDVSHESVISSTH